MGEASYRTVSDGLPARDADTWTEEKLRILDCYARGFAKTTQKAGGWYGLDPFAGAGLNYSVAQGVEIHGSPLVLLNAGTPEATEVLLCEADPQTRQVLEQRIESYKPRGVVFPGDANSAIVDMLDRVPRQAPAFAFLDPEGSELAWETIVAVFDHKRGERWKVEQLILFPTDMGFVRLAPDHPDKVTNIFGHERWLEIFDARRSDQITADEARGAYVRLYADGLRQLGYETVLDRQITKANGQPMYFLIFATDHDAGERIMDHCFDRVEVKLQETLFAPTSRRKRLKGG
jgi:three-Cys-motif partner protein